ncbi:MAG TPA: hypothetical protein VE265_01570 [Actinomycetota bacterium]|nr:hypothetical protein [Actinomycetota bacterium]
MPCPDLGALRASIDDAPGAAPALHDHVRACPSCSGALAELQHNAELAAPAIALTAPADLPPGAAEAALARFEQRRARLANAQTTAGATATLTATPAPATADPDPLAARRRGRRPRLGTRARGAAAALIAAVVLTGLVATPGGRAAAASFLAQFRSQRFEVLSLDPTQATQFEEVIGELVDTGVFTGAAFGGNVYGDPRTVADRDQASRMAGFAVPMVDPSVLPRGVGRTPERIMVIPARETAITFDRDHALDYLRVNGRPDARLPERFDGTRLVVQLPAVVIQQYAGRDGGPALLVGKAGMLGLDTEGGASLEELREVVLDLPGLPEGTVAQLRAIGDWRNTLPLPVPTDEVSWRATQVEGADAISFADP